MDRARAPVALGILEAVETDPDLIRALESPLVSRPVIAAVPILQQSAPGLRTSTAITVAKTVFLRNKSSIGNHGKTMETEIFFTMNRLQKMLLIKENRQL